MVPAYHTGGNIGGGGGFPPPGLSQFPLHICAENSLSSLCLFPPVPYASQLVLPAVPSRLKMTYDTSEALPIEVEYPTSFSLLYPRHTRSSGAPPYTLPPFPCHIPDTVLLPCVFPGMVVPPQSSSVHTMPRIGSPLPYRGSRSSLPSFHFFLKCHPAKQPGHGGKHSLQPDWVS